MNSREFNWYCHRFIWNTGIELWDAVQSHGITLWFFFDTLDDLVELSRTDDTAFKALVLQLEEMLSTKDDTISDKRVIYSIAISLYNTHVTSGRKKIEDSYISKLFITQDTARDIVSRYWPIMSNPLAMMVDPDNMYLSIIHWKRLDQPLLYVSNGPHNRPRPSGAFATKTQFNLLEIERIELDAYHPTIWYLLKEWTLTEYQHLFIKAIQLCQSWISNSIRKRRKTRGE